MVVETASRLAVPWELERDGEMFTGMGPVDRGSCRAGDRVLVR